MTAEGQLRAWLDALAALGGVVSAAEAMTADGERILFRHASGYRVGGERLQAAGGARFDAASLTKPWVATLALALDGAESPSPGAGLRLDAPLPGAATGGDGAEATLEDLLRHRSGMPAWTALALRLGGRMGNAAALRDFLVEARLGTSDASTAGRRGEPPPFPNERPPSGAGVGGTPTLYSDLGYVLWGLLAEQASGRSLAHLLDERVCVPLGVSPLGAFAADPRQPVECRLDNGREVELAAAQGLGLARSNAFHRGVPQDGNARALRAAGHFPAHAGLFVTVDEMLALAREWLRPGRLLAAEQVAMALAGGGDHALGWRRWSASGDAGPALSPRSFGHSGFTGGSVWIDPERERVHVLLSHRLASNADFRPFRREFHRLAAALG